MPSIKPSNPIIDWGNPITKGLVFDAPLTEGGGGKTKEIITSKEGIFTNTPTWNQKLLGNSLYFNGASSGGPYVDFPTNAQVNSLTKMSVEVWIYRLGNGGGSLERVLNKGSSSAPYWSLSFNNTGGNRIRIFSLWSETVLEYAFALTDMSDNAWHQIVFTLNDISASNPSPVVAYLDGVQKTLSLSQNGAGTPPTDSATITLGNSTAATRTVNGYISNSRIWNRILTPEEVKQLYADPWCIYQKPRFNIINSIGGGSSPSVSVSLSPSLSPSLSSSASVSPSSSISLSPSLSVSRSPSLSPSISPSLSPSLSASSSVSLSPSLSPSASQSPSSSVSLSPSLSISLSPSISPSASVSPSSSVSLSPSLSPSVSPSLSGSPSPSTSVSLSPSLSPSATTSPSSSISLSPSLSPSSSISLSPSASISRSPSTSFEPQTLSINLYKVMFVTGYNDKYSRKNNSYVSKYI